MSHVPHELSDEFPRDIESLHHLKASNLDFVNLAERYHDLNRQIHRIESQVESASDDYLEMLQGQRLALLDEIGSMVSAERKRAA